MGHKRKLEQETEEGTEDKKYTDNPKDSYNWLDSDDDDDE